MVAGIIVVAAADDIVLAGQGAVGMSFTGWLVLGGTGLFIGGQLIFKLLVAVGEPAALVLAVATADHAGRWRAGPEAAAAAADGGG